MNANEYFGPVTIVLYGATGYTGRLVTAELVRRHAPIRLAGRSPAALAAVSREHGDGAPWTAVAADDAPGLHALVADAAVVISCAGPFTLAGEALAAACAAAGTHYVDSTGEQTFMRSVLDRYGARAAETGAALVPAMGFDFAPGDCLARLVCRDVEPVRDLVLAYAVQGFGMTRGTLLSGLEMLAGDTVLYRDGRWVPEPRGPRRAWFTFPGELGRQRMSRYPAGEVVTVPRHTRVRNVTTLLTARTTVPEPRLAGAFTYAEPLLAATLRTPLRAAVTRAIGLLPAGPPEDVRRRAEFRIAVVATGEDGRVRRGILDGRDIYGLTAATLAWAAERMAAPGYDRAGGLGPAAAFDPVELLDAMAAHGVSYALAP
jgi:short subunit dehydrogenase-like uncharacterized protein